MKTPQNIREVVTDDSFEREILTDKKLTLVIFIASERGNCHLMEPIFERLSDEF